MIKSRYRYICIKYSSCHYFIQNEVTRGYSVWLTKWLTAVAKAGYRIYWTIRKSLIPVWLTLRKSCVLASFVSFNFVKKMFYSKKSVFEKLILKKSIFKTMCSFLKKNGIHHLGESSKGWLVLQVHQDHPPSLRPVIPGSLLGPKKNYMWLWLVHMTLWVITTHPLMHFFELGSHVRPK